MENFVGLSWDVDYTIQQNSIQLIRLKLTHLLHFWLKLLDVRSSIYKPNSPLFYTIIDVNSIKREFYFNFPICPYLIDPWKEIVSHLLDRIYLWSISQAFLFVVV